MQRTAPYDAVSNIVSRYFVGEHKNRYVVQQNLNDRISTIWWPLRGVQRPMWLPLRVFKRLARFACSFRPSFVPFYPASKNRHIASTERSNTRSLDTTPLPHPSIIAHYNRHIRPTPCAKHRNARRRFDIVSSDFVGRPKIDTSQTKISNDRISSMWCPPRVFEGPYGCPCGCSNGSLASLTRWLVST